MGIKNIRKQIVNNSGSAPKMHQVAEVIDKRCNDMKFGCNNDSSDEEESHVWEATDDSLAGMKSVIESLKDDQFYWDSSKDGKQSHKNFKVWLDAICDKLFDVRKKNNDELIFE